MARYIDADLITPEYLNTLLGGHYVVDCWETDKVFEGITKIPTADVQKVRHGHWVRGNITLPCSQCGKIGSTAMNYCYNCGAKMDEEANNES